MTTQSNNYQSIFAANPLLSIHADHVFKFGEKLGEGGMGAVYRVKDSRTQRDAALKMLSAEEATDQERKRFLREARITARLPHPSIPPIYELGMTSKGQLYMLMKVIEGETLESRIKTVHKGGAEASEIRGLLEVFVKICEAVSYAHSVGIVHRDLKPANIMIGEFGEVMVLDWGIAKDLAEASDEVLDFAQTLSERIELNQKAANLTEAGSMIGTVGYASPEQLDGEADEKSDVFSLGLILIEILTGQAAIAGETAYNKMVATIEGQIASPREINADIPGDLDWITQAATRVSRSERTATVIWLLEQVKAALNREVVPGYEYSFKESAARTIKEQSGKLLTGAVLVTMFSLLLTLWLALENSEQAKQSEQDRREQAEKILVLKKRELGAAKTEVEISKNVARFFNKAEDSIRRGAPKQSIQDHIQSALNEGKPNQPILTRAADLYSKAGFREKATEILKSIVTKYPPAYEALFQLHFLEVHKSGKGFIETEYMWHILREARENQISNEYTLFFEAANFANTAQYEKALKKYNEVEQLSKAFSWNYNDRGVVYFELKQFQKA
ncbi:MAG: serine/threonine-protein kinase, partial [Planctomycetota bacterium]|nr:serine/threonine-protein kinase [Planctomycetota bacterium]